MAEKKLTKKKFEVKGKFLHAESELPFSKLVSAHNESYAKELTYSLFGSKQRLPRRRIKIESVAEAK